MQCSTFYFTNPKFRRTRATSCDSARTADFVCTLIEPLGFELDERRLRRAGLDYRDLADVSVHDSLTTCLDRLENPRLFAFSTRAETRYADARFAPNDALLFGPETRGLPADVLSSVPEGQRLRLPMRADSRSLNLSNTVAIAVYEAWRQQGFEGGG